MMKGSTVLEEEHQEEAGDGSSSLCRASSDFEREEQNAMVGAQRGQPRIKSLKIRPEAISKA